MTESESGVASASASELLSQYALLLIAFTILYYDYLLTLPTEIAYFWPPEHKLTWASSFFFATRYLSLLGHVPVILEMFVGGDVELKRLLCGPLLSYHQYYAVVMQILVGILCIMRTYALYNRSWRVLGFLIAISIGSVVVACWAILTSPAERWVMLDIGVPGCNPLISQRQGKRLAYAWSSVLVFDTVIFGLTIWKTLATMRVPGSTTGSRRGGPRLLVVLLRDGTMYFSILFAANLSNILLLLFASPLLKGVNVTLTNVLSATLISRLMLNIRSAYSPSTTRRRRAKYEPQNPSGLPGQKNPSQTHDWTHTQESTHDDARTNRHTRTHTHANHHSDDGHGRKYQVAWSGSSGGEQTETETSGIYLDTVIQFPSTRSGTGTGTGTTWSLGAGGAALTGVERTRMDDGVVSEGRGASDEGVLDEKEYEGAERHDDRDWMGWMDDGGGGGGEGDVEMFAENPGVESFPGPNSVQGADEYGTEMVPFRRLNET